MKFTAVLLAAASLAAASAAFAAPARLSDVDYLKANRCKGLATTLAGTVDAEALDGLIKSERGTRAAYIQERADVEFNKARREARSEDRKERLTAELTGACSAYLGGASAVAKN